MMVFWAVTPDGPTFQRNTLSPSLTSPRFTTQKTNVNHPGETVYNVLGFMKHELKLNVHLLLR